METKHISRAIFVRAEAAFDGKKTRVTMSPSWTKHHRSMTVNIPFVEFDDHWDDYENGLCDVWHIWPSLTPEELAFLRWGAKAPELNFRLD